MLSRSLWFAWFAISCSAATLPPLDLNGVREEHIMIPTRDGVKLSAYLYFPSGDAKVPAVFEQRYLDVTGAGTRKAAADIARAGYAVAMVNFRGTHESEGVYQGYRAAEFGKLQDGYDVCEWLAAQPWSTGKVGTFGSSQGGYVQNYLAITQPPHLVCQYMVDTGLSLFQEGYRIGGATKPERFKAGVKDVRNPPENEALLAEWDRHPNYDRYWQDEDCAPHFDKMNVPCFTIGSWYDFMVQGSIGSYVGRELHGGPNSIGQQHIAIGPWLHGRLNKGSKVGEMIYPDNATFPELDHMVRWFDHFLKGVDNGVEKEPKVRYYTMGAIGEEGAPGNVWCTANAWPPQTQPGSWYLHDDGKLALQPETSAHSSTSYASDPRQPMSIPSGSFMGARDARPVEAQAEIRTWTSDALAEPVAWTGEVTAEVFVSSTAKDTDYFLRVSDVYPDGRSMLLMEYPMRARYRAGFDKQLLLVPGQSAKLAWHIGLTSIVFNKGHRIRVTMGSTGFPYYEPNNQTGGAQTVDWLKKSEKAINTIWHDASHPSRIIVPVTQVVSEARTIPVERHLAAGDQGYFPVAMRLHDGRIAVVLRGGGPHLSIHGRLDMIFSSNEGKTWTKPVVVVDSPLDDRNPALGEAKDGSIVVGFWRTATYDDQGRYNPKLDKPRNTWVTRSKDGGQTWSEPAEIDVSDIGIGSPFGKMVTLPDGAMLMAIYGFDILPPGKPRVGDRNHSYVYRSTDDGQTWKRLSEIGDGKWQFNETSLLRLPDGKIRAAMRSRGNVVWLSESTDDGRTWSSAVQFTPDNTCPADLCLLGDGRILMAVGDRAGVKGVGPFGALGLVSDARGHFDWTKRFTLVSDAVSGDCGYPSSVLLKDGRVLTVYYCTKAKNEAAWGMHCGAVICQPPAP